MTVPTNINYKPWTSKEWKDFFGSRVRQHELEEIPWDKWIDLNEEEQHLIASSLQEFQLGQASDGRVWTKRARQFAEANGDYDYLEAVKTFLCQERLHSHQLARFMALSGIPQRKSSVLDGVFRIMRRVGTLESSIVVLVSAECVARVYFIALARSTQHPILAKICRHIVDDEYHHIRFQHERLSLIRAERSGIFSAVTRFLDRMFLRGTAFVVFRVHRRIFRRAGMQWREFYSLCKTTS